MKFKPAQAIVIGFLLFFISLVQAAYVSFHPVTVSQPDGSALHLFASGDEHYNWLHDAEGYTVRQNGSGWFVFLQNDLKGDLQYTSLKVGTDNPAAQRLQPWTNIPAGRMARIRREADRELLRDSAVRRAPSSGIINNLTIFISFADQAEFTDSISFYDSMFNGAGNTMQAYYQEVSYGSLDVRTTYYPISSNVVISWQDSLPRAYYCPYDTNNNPLGYRNTAEGKDREHTLLANAAEGISSQVPDSLNLDGDGDGYVDNVCYVVKGNTSGWSDLLWPHRGFLSDRYAYINDKRVYVFNFQLSEFLADRGVGVLCHEMFHSIGAPDLYHYYYSPELTPVGPWDLMEIASNPPQHMGAYMKHKYGNWIPSLPELNVSGTRYLQPLTSASGQCYKISSPNSTSEYFVVEFRKAAGTFESSLPGSGILIYRINPAAGDGNAYGPPDEVYVFRPGGSPTANGDYYIANFSVETGRTSFDDATDPSCFLSDGSPGGLWLSDISSAGGDSMSFYCGLELPAFSAGDSVFSALIPIGGEASDSLVVSNIGGRTLLYDISVEEMSEARVWTPQQSRTGSPVRSIEGSALTLDATDYLAGNTMNWTFTVYNGSPDFERLKDIYITFPPTVTVNSATGFVGGGWGIMIPDQTSGTGITVHWNGQTAGGVGFINDGETAVATINVSVNPAAAGPIYLSYQLEGDIFGEEPHTLSGSIEINEAASPLSWLNILPLSGSLPDGQSQVHRICFSAAGKAPGTCEALISITTNDPEKPLLVVPVSMSVYPEMAAPEATISLAGTIVVLQWEPVVYATGYQIFSSTDPYGNYSYQGSTSGLSFEASTDDPARFFRVKAIYEQARQANGSSGYKH